MSTDKKGYVYILFNKCNGRLYIGVTSDLVKRVYEHKNGFVEGFTNKYETDRLGYHEMHDSIIAAIELEKRIKGESRKKKLELIEAMNPEWRDLYEGIV